MESTYLWKADNRYTVHRGRSKRWFAIGALINLGLILIMWFYATGTSVTLSTNLKDADLSIGHSSAVQAGTKTFESIPYGEHTASASRTYYEPFLKNHSVGIFTGHKVEVNLKQLPIRLAIRTQPGAEILVDGNAAGRADNNGNFEKRDLILGSHSIKVRMNGYVDWDMTREIVPPGEAFAAYLRMSPEKQQEIENQRREVWNLISEARQSYSSRQYNEALSALDKALLIDPTNQEAQQLKARVQETKEILNIP